MTSPAARGRMTRAAVGPPVTATTGAAAAGMAGRTGARPVSVDAPPGRAVTATAVPAARADTTGRPVTVGPARTAGDMTAAAAAGGGAAVMTAGPGRERKAAAGAEPATPGPTGLAAGTVRTDTAQGPAAGRAGTRPGRAGHGPAARLARPGRFPTYPRALPRTSSTRRREQSCARCPATWP